MAVRDWFGRDKNRNYVSEHSGERLRWDFGMTNSYSSFFAPDLDKQKLIKDSFRHVCDIRDIMEVPKEVRINLFAQEDSYSTTDEVVISTKVFDDTSLDSNQKLDIFLGLAIHEFSHVLYTEIENPTRVKASGDFVLQLANVIEDERIECKTTEKYPGYANFIKEVKYYFFDLKFYEEHIDDVMDVLQTVLYLIRYPGRVNEDIYNRHKPLFEDIKHVVSSLGNSYDDVLVKAKQIWTLICDYFKIPHDPPKPPKNKEEQTSSGKGSGSDKGMSSSDDSQSKEGDSSSNASSDEDHLSKSKEVEEKGSSRENKPGKGPSKTGKIDAVSEEELEKAAEKVARKIKSIGAEYSTERSTVITNDWVAREYSGELIRENDDLVFSKQRDRKSFYDSSKRKISPYINSLVNTFSKFFVEQEYKLTGLRRGKLDTNKLVEAFQNVDTVYNQAFKRTTPGLDICLLIDESGSMGGTKIEKAQAAAILLNEVCLKLPKCNLYIYGHTADITKRGDTVINVYRDSWNKNKYALGSVSAHCNNRDHEAIYETHKLVRKQTKNPLLMFVISDGYPAASGISSSSSGIKLVKDTVNKIEAQGNTIICQVAIEHSVDPKRMFNHYVILTDLKTFPKDLSDYVLKVLVSKLKRVDI